MTTPFENFVNTALGKSLSADVTLPTANDIPVFTGIGRQVTGKTIAELGIALTADLGTAAVFSDSDFRIQDNDNATKQLAFEVSGVATGTTRTITMPDANVDLGQTVKGSFTPKELLASSGSQSLEANYSYYLPAFYAGALNLAMPTSAAIGTTFDIGSIYSYGIDGTIGANLTALNLTVPAGEFITSWGGSPNPINLLVSYATGSDGWATPNFTQGCTFRLTKTGATSWAIKPTFGSVLPRAFLVKNEGGVGGTIVSTAVPAGTYRELTLPDADVDLGTLPSVATTDFNTLSGLRTRIVGGSYNTVSGTDNIAIGCFSTTLNGIGQVVLGASASARLKCNDITVLGSSQGSCTNVKHFLYKGDTASCYLSNAVGQANRATPDTTNCPRAALSSLAGVSLFELRFVSSGYDTTPAFVGSISGCRVFSVHSDGAGGYTVSAVATPYADVATVGVGISFAITVITAVGGEKLLQIIPTMSGLGGGQANNHATLDAIYQW